MTAVLNQLGFILSKEMLIKRKNLCVLQYVAVCFVYLHVLCVHACACACMSVRLCTCVGITTLRNRDRNVH